MFREWATAWRLRLRAVFRRRQLEQDLEDELAFHLAMKAEKLGGEAQSRRQFGNTTWFRETCRELWSLGRIEILWRDACYGARLLRRSPAFTAVAVLSLALGIGANTLIFSLINGMLLKSLPVPNPQELRVINWSGRNATLSNYFGSGMKQGPAGQTVAGSFSYPIYREFRDRSAGFSDVFAFSTLYNTSVIFRGEAFTSHGLMVSGNFFHGLGMQALLGRIITPEDDRPGAPPAVVVSYTWWERYANLDPGILGRTVLLSGSGYTVVGVLPRDFSGSLSGSPTDFFVPMAVQPQILPAYPLGSPKHWWLEIMARLQPGADERQAQAALQVLFVSLLKNSDQKIDRPGIVLEDGRRGPMGPRGHYKEPLLMLMAVVGLVLLIACANLASLLLARGAARQHEMALRAAIGASRIRLVRQSLTESLLVALAGGCLGMALAAWGKMSVLSFFLSGEDAPRFDFRTDYRVLAFTLGVSVLTALLFGLAPAFRAARSDPARGLKSGSAQGAPRIRLGKVLVVAQVCFSLLLVVGAGLFLRTLVNLWRVDPGFQPEGLLLFRLNARTAGYEGQRLVDFYERVRQSVAAVSGVRSVALSDVTLLSGAMSASGFTIPGRPLPPGKFHQAWLLRVGESFLTTMGIPLLLGRDLGPADNETAPRVAVVNQTLARSFFSGENPAGKTITMGKNDLRIVGICRDAKYNSLTGSTPPTVYLPYRQEPHWVGAMSFEVRTAIPPLAVAPAIRRVVAAMDRNVPVTGVKTQTAQIEQSLVQQRFIAALCGFFAALALLLSAIGLYGVMAYTVARRSGEIGIRMALGASRGGVRWMVLREALVLVAAGAVLGVPVALAATRVLQQALFGVEPNDPATLAGAVAVLLAVAALAAWVPARRATRVDPVAMLRSE